MLDDENKKKPITKSASELLLYAVDLNTSFNEIAYSPDN